MSEKNKPNFPGSFKGFKFKIYWIYALIFVFFIGLNFMGTEVAKSTNWQEFNQRMLQQQKVEKVVIVNKEKAYIYIKKEFLSEEQFRDVSKKIFGDTPNYGPHYFFEIGSVETFAGDLKDAQSSFENDELISPFYETRKDVFGDILGWILPLAFFIFIWLFIMKRMGGGAGGGGGQIFNGKRVFFRCSSEGIGRTINLSACNTTACQCNAENTSIMVPSVGLINLGGSTKFGGHHNERTVK